MILLTFLSCYQNQLWEKRAIMSVIRFGPSTTRAGLKRSFEHEEPFPGYPEYLFADITKRNIDQHHEDFPDRTSKNLVFSIVSHMESFPTAHPQKPWLTPPVRTGQTAYKSSCNSKFSWPSAKSYCEEKLSYVLKGSEHLYLVYRYDDKGDREVIAFMFWHAEYDSRNDGEEPYTQADLARFSNVECMHADDEISIGSHVPTPETTYSIIAEIDLLGAPPRVNGPKRIGPALIAMLEELIMKSSAKKASMWLYSLSWKIANSQADCQSGNYFGLSEHVYEPLGFVKDPSNSAEMIKTLR